MRIGGVLGGFGRAPQVWLWSFGFAVRSASAAPCKYGK
jgi:hypothetical protein